MSAAKVRCGARLPRLSGADSRLFDIRDTRRRTLFVSGTLQVERTSPTRGIDGLGPPNAAQNTRPMLPVQSVNTLYTTAVRHVYRSREL